METIPKDFLPLEWQAECKGENNCDHQSMTTGISVSRGAVSVSVGVKKGSRSVDGGVV